MIILKLLVLLSAAGTLILRFISFKYAETLGSSVELLTHISIACAVVCLISAGLWIALIKKEQKKLADREDEQNE